MMITTVLCYWGGKSSPLRADPNTVETRADRRRTPEGPLGKGESISLTRKK